MNETSTKKILYNKSTLFSLKAELLRKQEEVNEKKLLPQNKLENFKPPKPTSNEKSDESSKRSFKDNLNTVDAEEIATNRKVRLALEKKAELYDHLADSSGNSVLAERFLVDFNNKKQNEEVCEQHKNEEYDKACKKTENIEDNDNEWVEFTDCLGRTRKCHKSDLDLYKKRDKDLMRDLTKDSEEPEITTNKPEMPYLVQKTNDYLQSLREKWEEKEKELVGKDRDIHYQDLLFDEARIHGVGYYSFSTDETERRKQMEELMARRHETLRAQEDAEQMRKRRDELMAARVAAARARQRARAGLPPEEPKENQKDFTTCLLEFLTQQRNEADAKAKEEEKKAKEEMEKERQKLREAHIREWDLPKLGVEGKGKKFKEMTQEEYVEQQRSKRIKEFAPVASSSSKSDLTFDEHGRVKGVNSEAPVKTWADVRPKPKTPPPPDIGELSTQEQKGLYFSSSKKHALFMKYKNFVKAQEPVPIDNEISAEYGDDKPAKRMFHSNHAEIEPPPTYDYYGPAKKYSRPEKPFDSDINEAYAQGAKSLENKSNDRKLSKNYDFTFD